ncbi:hypothetical protein [Amycolatopsis nigrescens]|uniref:hypothetical protein n=1 Tax=Amycolatopsis nigrescens TaxID=381445 RepID=UPI00036613EF|nr:hypothetical protein [Amycolatopsis nigrescens]
MQDLQAGELDAVRAQAEKWRNGLGGLVALTTVVASIRGAGGAATLDTAGKIVAGALLLFAVAISAIGGFVAMRAAYGFPARRLAEASLDELITRRRDRLRRACRDLRRAVVMAYVSLTMVLGSLGITWFA